LNLTLKCHDPNLGLATNARAYKGAGRKWSSGFTFHAPVSVRECEGMNPHIPKWAPILRIGVSILESNFKGQNSLD